MKVVEYCKLDFDDVLIRPKRSMAASRSKVNLFTDRAGGCVPIIAANMDVTGTFAMAKSLAKYDMLTCLHKHYSVDQLVKFYKEEHPDVYTKTFVSIGIRDEDLEKICQVDSILDGWHHINKICIDVANGYTGYFIDHIKKVREAFPTALIMAGNVATPEMTEAILLYGGANIVKIGIGPGSVCTTRSVTGVGYPQLSAILECTDAAHGVPRGMICADGGCKTTGDIAKAFGANADFVMVGGMLAGYDECEGDWKQKEIGYSITESGTKTVLLAEKTHLKFYGMSSYEAQDKYNGKSDYRASEGKIVTVPYKGKVENWCKQVTGGLRSACAYVGAQELKHLGKHTTFIRVNRTRNQVFDGQFQDSEQFRT